MDTRFIEVAIGLVLVFALTSLLVSAIQEVYSSATGLRGRILRQALSSFCGDDENFVKAILEHPLMVSLSRESLEEKRRRLPSYANADTVVSTMISLLVDTHADGVRPQTPGELIEAVRSRSGRFRPPAPTPIGRTLDGTQHTTASGPNPQFVRGLASIAMGAEHDWKAFEVRLAAWYESVGERSEGWFKRKTRAGVFLIGFGVAALANINPIVIGSRLWEDDPLRQAVVTAANRATEAYADSLKSQASDPQTNQTAPRDAQGRVQAPDAAEIDTSLRGLWAVLDGVAAVGTVASETQALAPKLLVLETAVQRWRNADSNTKDVHARQMVASAEMLARAEVAPEPVANALRDTAALLRRTLSTPDNDTRKCVTAQKDASPEVLRLCERIQDFSSLGRLGIPMGWGDAAWPRMFSGGDNKPSLADYLIMAPLGWLIIALACTLGAPFWFDALSKLVKLRAAGSKTQGDARPTAAGEQGGAATVGKGMLTPAVDTRSAIDSEARQGTMSDALNDHEKALTATQVQRLQRALGMPEIEVSGWFDGNTRRSISSWQRQSMQTATGELSALEIEQLLRLRAEGSRGTNSPGQGSAVGTVAPEDEGDDCCGARVENPTPDAELVAARGGVADGST